MDAVMEFLIEGMHEAPLALGALAGFALGPVIYLTILRPLDRRHERKYREKLDRIMGRTDKNEEA